MITAIGAETPRLIELRRLHAQDLDPLLTEEIQTWRETLAWDFSSSAALVRRFIEVQDLSGFSLLANGRPIGYSYFVCEDHKGLIGDLYVQEEAATVENESRLLTAVLDALMQCYGVRRIECQLMMLRTAYRMALPHWRHLRLFERSFMEAPLGRALLLPPGRAARSLTIGQWTDRRHEEAAALIAQAYEGHVDSEINDQYRSCSGARKFLMNIVQYPGCGAFFGPASFVALDSHTGRLCGICLSSLVIDTVGHITQICVSKTARGKAVGYELMRHAMRALAQHNCRKVTLTVTSSNLEAIRLYQGLGFEKKRDFAAYVWEGF